MESMLSDCWAMLQAMPQATEEENALYAHATKCYGRLSVRSTLLLLSKQKASRESSIWPDQASILAAFTREMSQRGSQPSPAQEASSASGSNMNITDTITASAEAVALLQNHHMKLGELKPGCSSSGGNMLT